MQIIFHIDLNAFFASAEIANDPTLENKPIAISRNEKRSIVTTASYEARKYGIHSAMPLYLAKEKCPSLIVIEPHFSLYKTLSRQFFEIIGQYSTQLEVASIDECYVDMTDYIRKENISPKLLALKMQQHVYEDLHLKCSIGIAPNKFLAKMGSDLKKPMGITMITTQNFKEMIWDLPIDDMFGIGKKTAPKLKELGIYTIGDLAKRKNYDIVKPIFGKNAFIYYQKANGKDYSKINTNHNQLKSIGNSTTFQEDSSDIDFLKSKFKELSKEVSDRAKRRNMVSNSISITLKFSREKSISRQTVYDYYFNDFETIYSMALLLFEKNYHGEPLRLVGVVLNNVIEKNKINEQLSLFNDINARSNEDEIDKILKRIEYESQGKYSLKKASALLNNNIQNKYLENDE
ncbi:MAG: DNA polymerase IV [Bacilli bacterium]|nr:DNA polymerase IV [Bacilli bacterium]